MAEQKTLTVVARVAKAREQFHELTGTEPVSVSGLAHAEGGWELHVDVVEVRRVPDTASLLATYRVTTDDAGEVTGYERVRRRRRLSEIQIAGDPRRVARTRGRATRRAARQLSGGNQPCQS